jgi:hypothetical protein
MMVRSREHARRLAAGNNEPTRACRHNLHDTAGKFRERSRRISRVICHNKRHVRLQAVIADVANFLINRPDPKDALRRRASSITSQRGKRTSRPLFLANDAVDFVGGEQMATFLASGWGRRPCLQ